MTTPRDNGDGVALVHEPWVESASNVDMIYIIYTSLNKCSINAPGVLEGKDGGACDLFVGREVDTHHKGSDGCTCRLPAMLIK